MPSVETSPRDRSVRRVLWVVMFLNLAVAATKLILSGWTGSLSLVADGVHALLDAASNVVGLIGIRMASAPPDHEHPYGHRRFETLASLIIGFFIAAGLWEILQTIFRALTGARSTPHVTWIATAGVALTIAVNFFITKYESREARRLNSSILEADAGHTAADTLGAFAVLASFGGVALGFVWADVIAASVVAVLIARTSIRVLAPSLRVLADEARLDPTAVHKAAMSVEGVHGAHRIRSRGTPDHVHVDLHIHVDPSMSVVAAHALTHRVADSIRAAFPNVRDVVIHTEPADGRERDRASIAP